MTWQVLLGFAIGAGLGWCVSGNWRGTTRRGYLLALRHVEEMTRPGRRPARYTLDGAIEKLRDETSGPTSL